MLYTSYYGNHLNFSFLYIQTATGYKKKKKNGTSANCAFGIEHYLIVYCPHNIKW